MSTREPFRRYSRASRTSASDQNNLRRAVETHERAGGMQSRRMAGVDVQLPILDRWLVIQLDAPSVSTSPFPTYHDWHEVDLDDDGNPVEIGDGLVGSVDLPAISTSGYDAPASLTRTYIARISMEEGAVNFFAYPQTQGVTVRKNSTGSTLGPRSRLNLIEGSGTTLTIADDATDDEVDITIAAGSSATFSGASVTRTTDQSGLTGVNAVDFNNTEFDTDSYVSGDTFVAPITGYYMVGAWVLVFPTGTTGTGEAVLSIVKSGPSTVAASGGVVTVSGSGVHLNVSGLVQLNATQSVSLAVLGSFTAGSYFLSAGSVRMWICRILP